MRLGGGISFYVFRVFCLGKFWIGSKRGGAEVAEGFAEEDEVRFGQLVSRPGGVVKGYSEFGGRDMWLRTSKGWRCVLWPPLSLFTPRIPQRLRVSMAFPVWNLGFRNWPSRPRNGNRPLLLRCAQDAAEKQENTGGCFQHGWFGESTVLDVNPRELTIYYTCTP